MLKEYVTERQYREYQARYLECVRMLNGMEKKREQQLSHDCRRWPGEENASCNKSPP